MTQFYLKICVVSVILMDVQKSVPSISEAGLAMVYVHIPVFMWGRDGKNKPSAIAAITGMRK